MYGEDNEGVLIAAMVAIVLVCIAAAIAVAGPAGPADAQASINISQSQDFTVNVGSPPSSPPAPPAPLVNVQGFWGAAAVVLLGTLGITGGFLLILTVCVLVINQSFARQ
jgi:hypothetical protein